MPAWFVPEHDLVIYLYSTHNLVKMIVWTSIWKNIMNMKLKPMQLLEFLISNKIRVGEGLVTAP